MFFHQETRNTVEKYHLVRAESPFSVKTINWMHHHGVGFRVQTLVKWRRPRYTWNAAIWTRQCLLIARSRCGLYFLASGRSSSTAAVPRVEERERISQQLEMWANAQPDGRPAEYRWRPLFNAAKFG